jgi:hypothetical protein
MVRGCDEGRGVICISKDGEQRIEEGSMDESRRYLMTRSMIPRKRSAVKGHLSSGLYSAE